MKGEVKHTVLYTALVSLLILGVVMIVPLPDIEKDYSYILYDRHGDLLAAQVAADQQWRFPTTKPLPSQLATCIRYYEDEYFYWHPGINPVSVLKALWANVTEGHIVRGASTLSMQVMRMSRGNQPRTLWQKSIESLGALKLELFHSKAEIMRLWAGMAPFGGNTVGASTAAWRYFQRDLNNLSLAEYATLAVLPNSPATVHLSRNTTLLKKRRDFLLKKLWAHDIISELDYKLSVAEEVPQFQSDLPLAGWHMLQFCKQQDESAFSFQSTLDFHLQKKVQDMVDEFSELYQRDGIQNAAALVIDNQQNEVLAYVGNSASKGGDNRYVDCVQAPRSYGSLLKPFLYAYALDQGYFLPGELIKDIPTNLDGFAPKNFDRSFRGWVRFDQMVSQSLNVPAVRILNYVGLPSFHAFLSGNLQLKNLHADPHYHGLSLILGGAEATMWDMARIYKGLAVNLTAGESPYTEMQYRMGEKSGTEINTSTFDPVAVDHTLEAMASVERPPEEQHFVKFGGSEISWKTGTSYGHRDAWAVGTTPEYTVAVWVGNEDGEGVYNLTGAKKAAPILFRIIGSLPPTSDFQAAHSSHQVLFCRESGRLKGPLCTDLKYVSTSPRYHHLRQCLDHEVISSDHLMTNRIDTVLSLDPVANYYYENYHGQMMSKSADHFAKGHPSHRVSIVYPTENRVIFIPKKLNQELSQVKVSANSTSAGDQLFWYINGQYHSKTSGSHSLVLELPTGEHHLYVVNQTGQEDNVSFEVVKRNDS